MLIELTLVANFVLLHLVIGFGLFVLLAVVIRYSKVSPEFQSWLWITGFFLSTLVPFTSFVEEGSGAMSKTEVAERAPLSGSGQVDEAIAYLKAATKPAKPIESSRWQVSGSLMYRYVEWAYLAIGIWLLGVAWRSWYLARRLVATRSIHRREIHRSRPLVGVGRFACPVLVSDAIDTPLAFGLTRPVILLPGSLVRKLNPPQLRAIVLHEEAHVARKDIWISFLQQAVSVVFWFSPVVRLFDRKINITRELACDMRAAFGLSSRKRYAQSLLDCAKLMVMNKQNILAMGLFSQKKELTHRVNEVLNMDSVKKSKTLAILTACLVLSWASIGLAQTFAPKITVDEAERASQHFATLSHAKGEMVLEAIATNDYDLLHMMMDHGLELDSTIEGDGTPLMAAVKADNLEMVEYLLYSGVDVNQAAIGDGNPLIVAVVNDNLPMARYLLNSGADINGVTDGDETPLINASRLGNLSLVKFLIDQGADVNLGVDVVRHDGSIVHWTPMNVAKGSSVKDYLRSYGAR